MDSIGYLGIFVALVGAAGALWAGLAHRKARAQVAAAAHWRDAPGRIVTTDVERRDAGASTQRYFYYVPLVRYTYVVSGQERHGARLRFGMVTARSRGGAEKLLAPYAPGTAVQVRYDPDNPDESVLEAKASANLLVAWIACFCVVLVGVGIVVLAMIGVFSADVSGHWHVRFEADGVVYEGDMEAVRAAGPLTLAYTTPQGPRRAREDCTLTRNRQNVLVRCTNAQIIDGAGSYSPDNFDLTFQGGSRLTGSVTSAGSPTVGTATFTR